MTASVDADILVAGGVTSLELLGRLRGAGVSGVLLGEALFTGALDLAAARDVAA